MAGLKLKKGDKVIVLSGAEKGKTGKITEVLPRESKVVVEGINIRKKHQKPDQSSATGGVYEKAMPIDSSNVAIVHPSKKNQGSRVGYKIDAKGNKSRIYKANNKEIK